MAVLYECIYCGEQITSDMSFEGNIKDFSNWLDKKQKELSDQCKCQNRIWCKYFETYINNFGYKGIPREECPSDWECKECEYNESN